MTGCACVCPRDAEELSTVANSNGDGSVEVDDKETVLPRGCGESCVVTFRYLPSVRGNFRSLAFVGLVGPCASSCSFVCSPHCSSAPELTICPLGSS